MNSMCKVKKVTGLMLWALVSLAGCRETPCESSAECSAGEQCRGGLCRASTAADVASSAGALAGPDATMACDPALPGQLVINEVLADPAGHDTNGDGVASSKDDEYVEVMNLATFPVSVAGVAVRVGQSTRLVMPALCVGSGHVVVVFGGGAPKGVPGDAALVASGGLRLSNSMGQVQLMSKAGAVLDTMTYDGEQGGSHSFARFPEGTGPFQVHPTVKGGFAASPGACVNGEAFPDCGIKPDDDPEFDDIWLIEKESCAPAGKGDLILTEVLADPGKFDANGDGIPSTKSDEFVELLMTSPAPRELGGLELRVNGVKKLDLPYGCMSAPLAVVAFGGGTKLAAPAPGVTQVVAPKGLSLPNKGGTVSLMRGDVVVDQLVYGPEGDKDQSIVRSEDGAGAPVLHGTLAKAPASPGRCTSGELFATGCKAGSTSNVTE